MTPRAHCVRAPYLPLRTARRHLRVCSLCSRKRMCAGRQGRHGRSFRSVRASVALQSRERLARKAEGSVPLFARGSANGSLIRHAVLKKGDQPFLCARLGKKAGGESVRRMRAARWLCRTAALCPAASPITVRPAPVRPAARRCSALRAQSSAACPPASLCAAPSGRQTPPLPARRTFG